MATLADLQKQAGGYLGQLNSLNEQIKQYTPVDAGEALKDFTARVGNFAPQYAELRGLESQAQQTPGALMQQYFQQYGGTTGLDPMARLNAIQGQMSNIMGTRNALSDVINTAGGRLSDLAKSAVTQYGNQLTGLQTQYGNIKGLYDSLAAQVEAEKSRRAAAAQAAMFGGGYGAQAGGVEQGGTAYVPPGGSYGGKVYAGGATLTGADAAAYRQQLAQQMKTNTQAVGKQQGINSLLSFITNPIQGNINMFQKYNPLANLFR